MSDKGINPFDSACHDHHILHVTSKKLEDRHKVIEHRAFEKLKAKDTLREEKIIAFTVTNAMKAKRKIGMGCKRKRKRTTKKINNGKRLILTPGQSGGAIPLIPIFAGLSALSSLMTTNFKRYYKIRCKVKYQSFPRSTLTRMLESDILDISSPFETDSKITNIEYHSYTPYKTSFNNNDEVRISIQQTDIYPYLNESFIYLEGQVSDAGKVKLTNNGTPDNYNCYENAGWIFKNSSNPANNNGEFSACIPLKYWLGLFEDFKRILVSRLELILTRNHSDINALKVITSGSTNSGKVVLNKIVWKVPHITVDDEESSIKDYLSGTPDNYNCYENSGWIFKNSSNPANNNGDFSASIPLKYWLGVFEDFKRILVNSRLELILTRSHSDLNALKVITSGSTNSGKVVLNKIVWKVPHITIDDEERLKLLKLIEKEKSLFIPFRSFETFEYPELGTTKKVVWKLKTASKLEKTRFIIIGLQKERKNSLEKDCSIFDHCNITNVKVFLNSIAYPYDNLNLDFTKNNFTLLYDMYMLRQIYEIADYMKSAEKLLVS
ncbi:Uncharacterized protein FWK35_00022316 [Aphis craccivora]|uniref:Double jelly roll-like domain-containing protein n=1 Tax=Aphis craccivora TaxID=307492 RepID=A0A6G0VZM0_APHCR|nr:Uncharacterized protein FWK35_00022316 [Aphis craccivora]